MEDARIRNSGVPAGILLSSSLQCLAFAESRVRDTGNGANNSVSGTSHWPSARWMQAFFHDPASVQVQPSTGAG